MEGAISPPRLTTWPKDICFALNSSVGIVVLRTPCAEHCAGCRDKFRTMPSKECGEGHDMTCQTAAREVAHYHHLNLRNCLRGNAPAQEKNRPGLPGSNESDGPQAQNINSCSETGTHNLLAQMWQMSCAHSSGRGQATILASRCSQHVLAGEYFLKRRVCRSGIHVRGI